MQPVNMFVYGSLREGMGANYMMGGKPVSKGLLKTDGYTLVEVVRKGWPGLIKADLTDTPQAVGEVYEVSDPAVLEQLDSYEGYPSLFGKAEVEVALEDGTTTTCTTYVYNSSMQGYQNSVVPEGDWVKHMGVNQ